MHFAETFDKNIAGFCILLDLHGGIFFGEAVDACKDFIFFALFLCGNCKRNAGSGELDGCELDRFCGVGQSIAGVCELKLCHCADVACAELVNVDEVLAAHHVNRAGFFTLFGVGVVCCKGCINGASINLHDGDLTDKGVSNGLHDLSGKLAVALDFNGFACAGVDSGADGRLVSCGHIVNKVVHEGVNAGVEQCGNAANGSYGTFCNTEVETANDLFLAEFHCVKISHHELFIAFCGCFHKSFAQFFGTACERSGNVDFLFALAVESLCGHGGQVNVTDICAFFDNGELNGNAGNAELVVQAFDCLVKVCVFAIHLVDDDHAGHICLFAHAHCFFGADNGTGNCAANDNCGIGKSHCFVYFAIEIKETGSVNKVYFGSVPLKGSNSCADGNVSFGFFGIIVGNGRAVVNLAHAVEKPCIEKHCFSQSGFAFSAVAEDGNIADAVSLIVFISLFISPLVVINN